MRAAAGCVLAVLTMGLVSERLASIERGYDPLFGNVYAPGSTARWRLEGDGLSHWTHQGIRRAPWLPAAGSSTILVLGDSFTEALQVDDHEVYTTLAEESLRGRGRAAVVLNAGESDRSVADYVALAPAFRTTFAPDWVVVQVFADDFLADAWDATKARFVPGAGGGLAVDQPRAVPPEARHPAYQAVHALANASALVRFTWLRLLELREWVRQEPAWFTAAAASGRDGPGREYPVELALEALVEAFDGRLTLLLLSRYAPGGGEAGDADVERRIERFAAGRGISLVRLRDGFADFAERGVAPYGFPNSGFNKGHLNAAGHRTAARLLAAELERIMVQRGLH